MPSEQTLEISQKSSTGSVEPIIKPDKDQEENFLSWLPFGGAVIYYLLNMLVISNQGNFPINDDYVYGLSVQHFLKTGELQLFASGSACYLHILIGALASKLFGFSFEVLRSVNLTMGFLSIIAIFLTARELKVRRSLAGACAALYAINPIMVNLQFSFMTDITASTLTAFYIYFFVRGITRGSSKAFVFSAVMLTMAVLTRQSNVIFLPASLAALAFLAYRKRLTNWLAALPMVFPLVAMLISDRLMENSAWMVEAYRYHKDLLRNYLAYSLSAPLSLLKVFFLQLSVVGSYLGLFTLPLIISVFNFEKAQFPLKSLRTIHLVMALLFYAFLYEVICHFVRIPIFRNIWNVNEIGASGLIGQLESIEFTVHEPTTAAALLGYAGLLIVLLSASEKLFSGLKSPRKKEDARTLASIFCFLVLGTVLGFVTINTSIRAYDRYVIEALIPTLLCLAIAMNNLKLRILLVPSLILFLLIGFETTRQEYNYMSWNRSRWQAAEILEKAGISPARIDGGAEYNMYKKIELWNCFEIGNGKHQLHLRYKGRWPGSESRWWPVQGDDYVISFKPIYNYSTLATVPIKTILPWKFEELLILKHASVKESPDLSIPEKGSESAVECR